ncbi:MAG: trypsin-like peptidase domain-containing protein, partial [Chthoniobacteraceae bacterium]
MLGAALACALAYLARWPILVALPGVIIGVLGGVILVTRNRPLAGIAISLSATLLPIALLPSRTPASVEKTVARLLVPPRILEEPPLISPPKRTVEKPVSAVEIWPEPIAMQPADTPPSSELGLAHSAVSEPVTPAPPIPVNASAAEGSVVPPPAVASAPSSAMALPPIPQTKVVLKSDAAVPNGPRPEDFVFLIETGTGQGSGFLAATNDVVHLYTNLHVISGAEKIGARNATQFFDFRNSDVEVAADRDLVRFPVPIQAALRFTSEARIDQDVTALGNSGGRGVVTRLEGKVLGIGPSEIEVSTPFILGNSGGPIVNGDQLVVGVSTYMIRTENLPEWIKSGSRFGEARRFAVRVTDDIKWVRISAAALVQQTKSLELAEELLMEYARHIRTMSSGLFAVPLTSKFQERGEMRVFIDSYNRTCADYARRHGRGDRTGMLRDA